MRKRTKIILFSIVLIGVGFLPPDQPTMPVSGASAKDWNSQSFWYEPWGSSGVHKGVDIFAAKNTPVVAANNGLILFRGELGKGGKVVLALGPKWRLYYFAHLQSFAGAGGRLVKSGQLIGAVGDSGNAVGKPAHLHFSLLSLLPMPWLMDTSTQGYKKAFYLDAVQWLAKL